MKDPCVRNKLSVRGIGYFYPKQGPRGENEGKDFLIKDGRKDPHDLLVPERVRNGLGQHIPLGF